MTMARYQFTVTDEAGNVIPGAHIEVRKELPGAALAALKSDRDGLVGMSNPFDADSEGFAAFHVVGGAYKVRAYTGASGAPTFERIWRYVAVGLASETDAVVSNDFDTKADVESTDVSPLEQYIRIAGYSTAGDGGGALYKRTGSEPSHEGKIQSNDGAWWELSATIINAEMFGAAGDGAADDTASLQALADYACLVGAHVIFPSYKEYKITAEIVWMPQVSDGYTGVFPPTPSDILFLQKRSVVVSMNGSKITAAAAMTSMFRFTFDGTNDWLAPFFSRVNGGVFDGGELATNAIYSEWCLGFETHGNRIFSVSSGIKISGFGAQVHSHNHIRAAKCFDLTDGGADTHYGPLNDLYPSQCGFYMTSATGGQLRIESNAATNESGATVNFIEINASANSNVLRDVAVLNNGVAGVDNLIYARGNSSAFNNRRFVVTGNNVLDYGSKTTIGLLDTTETFGWVVNANTFFPSTVTSTKKTIFMTNDADSVVSSNFIGRVDQSAIHMAFSSRTIVSGNILKNVGSASSTKAIRVTNGSSSVQVHHNTVDQDSSSYAQNGIVEEDTSNTNVFTENIFVNVSTPYTTVGAATIAGSVTVAGMAIYKATSASAQRTIMNAAALTGGNAFTGTQSFTDTSNNSFTVVSSHATAMNVATKHLPSGNGATNNSISYTFNFKDDAGTEYNAMNWVVNQDDAAAASRDASLTLQTVTAGTLGYCAKFGAGMAVGPFGTADPGAGRVNVSSGYYYGNTKVVGTRATGYTNAMTGTANRATAYATGTITLIQLAERVKAIEDDLIAHGLIWV